MTSIEWYRVYHGMPEDAKLKVVAKRCGHLMTHVVTVWLCVLDAASRHKTRGTVQVDSEQIAVVQDIPQKTVEDKVIDKVEFEVKKKRLKDRQYQIDDLIRSFDEADDAFNEKLLNLVELAARAISHFKGSDIPRKRELLNFIFQNLSLRGKKLEYTMRSPFKEFAEASKIEEWSCLQSQANLSLGGFPYLTGKLQGNWVIFGIFCLLSAQNTHLNQPITTQFPANQNRELFLRNRE